MGKMVGGEKRPERGGGKTRVLKGECISPPNQRSIKGRKKEKKKNGENSLNNAGERKSRGSDVATRLRARRKGRKEEKPTRLKRRAGKVFCPGAKKSCELNVRLGKIRH